MHVYMTYDACVHDVFCTLACIAIVMAHLAHMNEDRKRLTSFCIFTDICELIASSSVVGGIIDFAEKENIELIVVGTRGRSGLKRLLLSSVASGIVNYAHCPVMIVK
jgi:nucleotide-binding universal stress UspA family protein